MLPTTFYGNQKQPYIVSPLNYKYNFTNKWLTWLTNRHPNSVRFLNQFFFYVIIKRVRYLKWKYKYFRLLWRWVFLHQAKPPLAFSTRSTKSEEEPFKFGFKRKTRYTGVSMRIEKCGNTQAHVFVFFRWLFMFFCLEPWQYKCKEPVVTIQGPPHSSCLMSLLSRSGSNHDKAKWQSHHSSSATFCLSKQFLWSSVSVLEQCSRFKTIDLVQIEGSPRKNPTCTFQPKMMRMSRILYSINDKVRISSTQTKQPVA